MRHFILILLFPLFAISQNNREIWRLQHYNTNKFKDRDPNEIVGSRFYHEKFLVSTINGKKAIVKFDAYKDAMYVSFKDNYYEYILPSKNNFVILLGGKEPWLSFDNKWYRFLFKKGGKSYLFKPIVEFVKPRKANSFNVSISGYEDNKPGEFKMKKKLFVLEAGILNKVSKKEAKKDWSYKMINSLCISYFFKQYLYLYIYYY